MACWASLLPASLKNTIAIGLIYRVSPKSSVRCFPLSTKIFNHKGHNVKHKGHKEAQKEVPLFPLWLVLLRFFPAEDALKNLIHIAQLPVEIKGMSEFLGRQARGDVLVFLNQLAKVQPLLPGAHGMFLHDAVSIFA